MIIIFEYNHWNQLYVFIYSNTILIIFKHFLTDKWHLNRYHYDYIRFEWTLVFCRKWHPLSICHCHMFSHTQNLNKNVLPNIKSFLSNTWSLKPIFSKISSSYSKTIYCIDNFWFMVILPSFYAGYLCPRISCSGDPAKVNILSCDPAAKSTG